MLFGFEKVSFTDYIKMGKGNFSSSFSVPHSFWECIPPICFYHHLSTIKRGDEKMFNCITL